MITGRHQDPPEAAAGAEASARLSPLKRSLSRGLRRGYGLARLFRRRLARWIK